MNKLFLIFLFLIAAINLCAAPVDPTTAAKVATNFYRQQTMSKTLFKQQAQPELLDVTAQTPYQHIYVFNAADSNGFVLVAGDDRSIPVLGYSDEGRFDYDNLPDNARSWINHYEQEIAYIVEHDAEPYTTTANEWETLRTGGLLESKGGSVEPLIKTKWGQINPNRSSNTPIYNKYCPRDNGVYTPTGCAATAMAQIMKYWEYPSQGTGSHTYIHSKYGALTADFGNTTYNWANMPNELSSSSSTSQINAVAQLMYHCGVACDMDYGVDGSGIPTSNIPIVSISLKHYFKYDASARYVEKSNYSEIAWINLLKTELDNKRPVFYGGESTASGGHVFVCDGYNDNDYFHFNWGWYGTANGYFYSSGLNPTAYGEHMSFSYKQIAIISIKPTIQPDQYEPNNTTSTAYNLGTVNSTSNSYTVNANFHLTTDNDYYKGDFYF